ncbi:probable RNA-directed DNA polymerase from transposon BS [Trichonephila clavipes]|nr:probable RNA-directed DNA polymerase from transposon BS [Trichonephila clavipes]
MTISRKSIGLKLCSWNANGILNKISEFKIFVEKHSPDLALIQETHLRPHHNINIPNYNCYRNDRIAELSSDHNPVILNFSLLPPIHHDNSRAVTTCWSAFKNNLKNNVKILDYQGIKNPTVLEDKIEFFTAAVRSAHQFASYPIPNKKHAYTPNYIHNLIRDKNRAKKKYNNTLNPIDKQNYYRLQEKLKKELKKISQENWNNKLESLNTRDNSLWQCQRFFRKKRSNIPSLTSSSGVANSDDQKANILASTLQNNFSENKRPGDGRHPIDQEITNTLNNFFDNHPLIPILPTEPDEILNYIKSLKNNKAPGSDLITNKMANSPAPGFLGDEVRNQKGTHPNFDIRHRTSYYKAQANLKKALKKHSQQSWQTRFESLNTTDNSLWQCQKFFRKKRSSIPNLISSSGPACSDDQKANLLAITLKDNFTENERPNGDYPIDNIITSTLENFFYHPPPLPITPTDPDEVLNYIKTLSNNKAPGKDNITNKMVKHFPLKIILLLTFLINKILLLRHFPNNWKIALVFPIKKQGKNSKSPSSYRPISLLSILSKITEHIILNRLRNFTDSINYINPNQYGFTRHLSTYHPLLRLTEKITSGFQRGRSTGAVFLDIQKAFDRVWTAEITSSPRPLSPSMSTNKETLSQKQANQHQAPNTLSMGRRNASRSSAQ